MAFSVWQQIERFRARPLHAVVLVAVSDVFWIFCSQKPKSKINNPTSLVLFLAHRG